MLSVCHTDHLIHLQSLHAHIKGEAGIMEVSLL